MFSLTARAVSHVPQSSTATNAAGQHHRQPRSSTSSCVALVQLGSSRLVTLRPCPHSNGQSLVMTLHQEDAFHDSPSCHISAGCDASVEPGQVIRAIAAHPVSSSTGQAFTLDHDGHVLQYAFGIEPSPFIAFKRKIASFPMGGLGPTEPEPALVCLTFTHATGFAVAVGRTVYVWLHHYHASSGEPKHQRLCLEDHSSPVVGICIIESLIVTLSADHSFKLWDIGHQRSAVRLKCVFQSEIFSAVASPTFMTTDHRSSLYIGSSDGTVRVFQAQSVPTAPFVQVRALYTLPVAKWIADSVRRSQEDAGQTASTVCISAKGGQARRVLAREDSGMGIDAAASLSPAIMACHVVEGRVYAVSTSHLVVCSAARQEPLLVHDFRDPLNDDGGQNVVGLLQTAHVLVGPMDTPDSIVSFALVPLVRKLSMHFVLLEVIEASLNATSPSRALELTLALAELSIDEPLSNTTPLSHVLQDAIALQHGRSGRPTKQRTIHPDKWLQSIADTTLEQLDSVHITTFGDLLHHRDVWSGPKTQLALPLGVPKVLDILLSLCSTVATTLPGRISLDVQEVAHASALHPHSPLQKHAWTNKPTAAPSKLDKQITFRSSVKSSGYSSAPTIPKHFLATRKKSDKSASPATALSFSQTFDPAVTNGWDRSHTHNEPWPPPTMVSSHPCWLPGPISCIVGSPQDSRYIVVGGADGTAHVLRLSSLLSSKSTSSPSIICSNCVSGAIKSSSWSHDDRMIMMSSSNVVRIWEPRVISKNPTAPGTEDPSVDLPVLTPWSISMAQFVHKSRLALVAHKNRIELFKYQLSFASDAPISKQKANHLRNTFTSADLKPRLPSGRAKSVWHLSAPNNAQQVTALAAWNNRAIPLVVFATSDKSLCVADLNQGVLAARVKTDSGSASTLPTVLPAPSSIVAGSGPPSRFIHSIFALDPADPTTPSHFSPHLFLTTAHGDAVRLWDMRTMTTVVRFGSHLPCARHLRDPGSTGAILSPYGTMVAVPTDLPGQAIALFDIRKAGNSMANQVGALTVMQSQVKNQSTNGRPSRASSRPGSVMGNSATIGRPVVVGTGVGGEAAVRVPRCASMSGELVGGMAFHTEKAVLVVGTTRGGLLSFSMG